MKVIPLRDRIMIKCDRAEGVTTGGIMIPDKSQEKPETGEVVATGKGKVNKFGHFVPLQVQVGDKAIFPPNTGSRLTIETSEYLLIREEELLGVVR